MSTDSLFAEKFNHHFIKIDEEINLSFNSRVPLVENIGKHSLSGAGKRIRPLLFVLVCGMCKYERDDIYHVSTLFEHMHTASLLHDDVIDNAETRRGKPSASHIWGNSAAVLSGDYLFSLATAAAASSSSIEFVKIVAQTASKMTEGQVSELVNTGNLNLDREEYMRIITYKTAELMAATCTCGAIIAGQNKDVVANLHKFGINMGIAFQLMDDLLDYTSSEEKFGKPVGKDLKECKTTLPLIYTLMRINGDDRSKFEAAFKGKVIDEKEHDELISLVRKSGAIDKVKLEAEEHVKKAAGFLKSFPESQSKADLMSINEYVIKRDF
ncbi:MAG: polyprenyl synthetase family protein [Deltaproteobacteria bacterium]|nr:polyprenyl synthetase family protein [Deltaproteobacteria bacterium]MBW1913579.1 polyprenyl synthetase family protein [Deltaproteobacteria bacterium]